MVAPNDVFGLRGHSELEFTSPFTGEDSGAKGGDDFVDFS